MVWKFLMTFLTYTEAVIKPVGTQAKIFCIKKAISAPFTYLFTFDGGIALLSKLIVFLSQFVKRLLQRLVLLVQLCVALRKPTTTTFQLVAADFQLR